jgi:hypothetical protein
MVNRPPPNTPHFSIAEGLKARIYRAFLRVQCRFKLAITLMAIDETTANGVEGGVIGAPPPTSGYLAAVT